MVDKLTRFVMIRALYEVMKLYLNIIYDGDSEKVRSNR